MDFSSLLTHAWFVVLTSLVVTIFVFPLALVFSFLYRYLCKRYKQAPWVLWMLVCVFLGVVCGLFLLEVYLGYTLPETVSALTT